MSANPRIIMDIAIATIHRLKICSNQFTPLILQRYSKTMFPIEERRIKASKTFEELLGKRVFASETRIGKPGEIGKDIIKYENYQKYMTHPTTRELTQRDYERMFEALGDATECVGYYW